MTMADRNLSRRRDQDNVSNLHQNDPQFGPLHPRASTPQQHYFHPEMGNDIRDTYDRNRLSSLELSQSPSPLPGTVTRDSGYNTDVSPATTISPATNTSRQPHFIFDDIETSRSRDADGLSPLGSHGLMPHVSAFVAPASPLAQIPTPQTQQTAFEQRRTRHRSTPPLRLSPEIFRASVSPISSVGRINQVSSRPMSEASDTNRVQFDFESDEEDEERSRDNRPNIPVQRRSGRFDHSGHLIDLSIPDIGYAVEEEEEEDVFYSRRELLQNWGISSEPNTPRLRTGSLSLRQRRYCSETDESHLGACGGRDEASCVYFGPKSTVGQRSHSFSESRSERNNPESLELENERPNYHCGRSLSRRHSDFSLTCSQGFQPGFSDTSENVFTFDPDDIDGDQDYDVMMPASVSTPAVIPVVRDRPPQSPASIARRRRVGIATQMHLSSGLPLPWGDGLMSVSRSTQTPHRTSIMIDEIISSPAPLPNESRGTAASRLRHLSESGAPLPPSPVPLPDIIPVGRDRSLSAPDLQALARQRAREAGRQVGRELRRLSDEFSLSFRRNLSPVHEEFNGHPSSFPGMRPTYIRSAVSHFGAFLRGVLRHGSSVDLTDLSMPDESPRLPDDGPGL